MAPWPGDEREKPPSPLLHRRWVPILSKRHGSVTPPLLAPDLDGMTSPRGPWALARWTIPVSFMTVLLLDGAIAVSHLGFPALGLLDEPAHAATAILVLAALKPGHPLQWLIAFFVGAVGIDLDHVPLLFGSDAFSSGTGRPYTHSLLTVALALGLAAATPRGRSVVLAFALGLVTHLSRDLATGGGVALLWPFTPHRLLVPYVAWVGSLSLVACWAYALGPISRLRSTLR